jgi:hypothetical protein
MAIRKRFLSSSDLASASTFSSSSSSEDRLDVSARVLQRHVTATAGQQTDVLEPSLLPPPTFNDHHGYYRILGLQVIITVCRSKKKYVLPHFSSFGLQRTASLKALCSLPSLSPLLPLLSAMPCDGRCPLAAACCNCASLYARLPCRHADITQI